jgi:hypothetical protein
MVFEFNFDLGLLGTTSTSSILMTLAIVWVGLCENLSLLGHKSQLYVGSTQCQPYLERGIIFGKGWVYL